ncbi:MAG TPA: hypothetical protein VHJ83_07460 [Micromonosporaceae bacterium]|nr:hypothetical protein [Micromonosporaceae bacterium]
MGLDVRKRVSLRVVDASGAVVSGDRIDYVRLGRTDGGVLSVTGRLVDQPLWVPVARVARGDVERPGWTVRPLRYRLDAVVIDGSNVVNRGQQRFDPNKGLWEIRVQQYDLKVTGRDAVFSAPAGDRVILTRPDGSRISTDLDTDHSATFAALPRGSYEVRIEPSAVRLSYTMLLSRDQSIEVKVLPRKSLAVVLAVLVLVAGALWWVGRRPARAIRRWPGPRLAGWPYRVTTAVDTVRSMTLHLAGWGASVLGHLMDAGFRKWHEVTWRRRDGL